MKNAPVKIIRKNSDASVDAYAQGRDRAAKISQRKALRVLCVFASLREPFSFWFRLARLMPSNNKSKKRVAPDNMILEEVSEFWDKHSFLDYDDAQEVHFDVRLKGEKHFFAVEKDLAKQIHGLAQRRGVSAETLVTLCLKAKLAEAA